MIVSPLRLSEVKLPLSADLSAVMSRGNKTTVGFEIPSFGLPQLARTIAALAVKSKEIVDELVKTVCSALSFFGIIPNLL